MLRNTAINALRLKPNEEPTEEMIEKKMKELKERESSHIEVITVQSGIKWMIQHQMLKKYGLLGELGEDDDDEDFDEGEEEEEDKEAETDSIKEGEKEVVKEKDRKSNGSNNKAKEKGVSNKNEEEENKGVKRGIKRRRSLKNQQED